MPALTEENQNSIERFFKYKINDIFREFESLDSMNSGDTEEYGFALSAIPILERFIKYRDPSDTTSVELRNKILSEDYLVEVIDTVFSIDDSSSKEDDEIDSNEEIDSIDQNYAELQQVINNFKEPLIGLCKVMRYTIGFSGVITVEDKDYLTEYLNNLILNIKFDNKTLEIATEYEASSQAFQSIDFTENIKHNQVDFGEDIDIIESIIQYMDICGFNKEDGFITKIVKEKRQELELKEERELTNIDQEEKLEDHIQESGYHTPVPQKDVDTQSNSNGSTPPSQGSGGSISKKKIPITPPRKPTEEGQDLQDIFLPPSPSTKTKEGVFKVSQNSAFTSK